MQYNTHPLFVSTRLVYVQGEALEQVLAHVPFRERCGKTPCTIDHARQSHRVLTFNYHLLCQVHMHMLMLLLITSTGMVHAGSERQLPAAHAWLQRTSCCKAHLCGRQDRGHPSSSLVCMHHLYIWLYVVT
jgi:hypothetical protein